MLGCIGNKVFQRRVTALGRDLVQRYVHQSHLTNPSQIVRFTTSSVVKATVTPTIWRKACVRLGYTIVGGSVLTYVGLSGMSSDVLKSEPQTPPQPEIQLTPEQLQLESEKPVAHHLVNYLVHTLYIDILPYKHTVYMFRIFAACRSLTLTYPYDLCCTGNDSAPLYSRRHVDGYADACVSSLSFRGSVQFRGRSTSRGLVAVVCMVARKLRPVSG